MLKKNKVLTNLSAFSFCNILSNNSVWENILFFDIETTGLNWKHTIVYLIGAVSYENKQWILTQWFAQTPEEEEKILLEFCRLAWEKSSFFHYNGNHFDLPYLQHKCTQYRLKQPFENCEQIDLYQRFSPLKKMLKLEKLRQKDLEFFLSYPRKDTLSGLELIKKYKSYNNRPSDPLLEQIMLHNRDDLEGMVHLLSMTSYLQIKKGDYGFQAAALLPLNENDPGEGMDLLVTLSLSLPLPAPFSYGTSGYYLTGRENTLRLKASAPEGILKLYYGDYKNYYYLPLEDTAVHKSIGSYVDRDHRVQATLDTCYQKFSCTGEFLSDPGQILQYVKALISYLL